MIIESMLNPNIDPTNFELFKVGKEGHSPDSQGRVGLYPIGKNEKCPLWDHPFGVPSGIVVCPQRNNTNGASGASSGGKGFLETAWRRTSRFRRRYAKPNAPNWVYNGGYLCGIVLDDRKVGFAYSDTQDQVQTQYEIPIHVSNSEGQVFKYNLKPDPVAGPREIRDSNGDIVGGINLTNPEFQGGKVWELADDEPDFDPSLTRWKNKLARFDDLPNVASSNWTNGLNRAWAFGVSNNGAISYLQKMSLTSHMLTGVSVMTRMVPCTELSSSAVYFSGDSHSMFFVYHATEGWCWYGMGRSMTAQNAFTDGLQKSWATEDPSLAVPNDAANRVNFADFNDTNVSAKITTGKDLYLAKPHVGVVRPAVTATNGGAVSSTPKKVDIPIYYKDCRVDFG